MTSVQKEITRKMLQYRRDRAKRKKAGAEALWRISESRFSKGMAHHMEESRAELGFV